MSSTSSQELAVSASDLNEQECEPSRSVRSTRSADVSSQSTGQMFHDTRTSENLETCEGSLSSVAASPASHSAQLLEDGESHKTYGLRCSELFVSQSLDTSSEKTFKNRRSPTRLETSADLVMQRTTAVYQGLTAGRTIKEIVGGLLHTPTRKANFVAPSMQKWPSCRRYVAAFGGQRITPEQFEFLMGFPIGWTRLPQSETPSSPKFPKRSDEQS